MADGSMEQGLSAADIRRQQRTAKGIAYDRFIADLRTRLAEDPDFAAERKASLAESRSVTPGEVHSNAFMTKLSVQYKNDDYIGELVMPVAPVDKLNDNFPTYNKRERLNAPDDSMQFRSRANQLNETRGSDSYLLTGYALENSLEVATEENQDPAFDEMVDLVEATNEALAIKREIRIATAVNLATNYSGNTVALTGADRWDSSSGGNPIKNMQDGLAACWQGRGPGDFVGVCNLDVWNCIARHPAVLDLFKGTMPGLTKQARLAQEIGLANIYVGAARYDTANIGATASYGRIWAKNFSIVRVARTPTVRNAAFGYTIRKRGEPKTLQWFDPREGTLGAYFAKVAFHEQQKVIAGDTGYLFETVIS